MSSGTLTWILIGVGVVLVGLLFLLGPAPEETAVPPAAVEPAPSAPAPQPVAVSEETVFWEPVVCSSAAATCISEPEVPCESPCVSEAPASGGCSVVPLPCPCGEGDDCGAPLVGSLLPNREPPHPRDRPRPLIDRHYPPSIDEGVAIPLSAEITNPGCVQVCFVWSASKGRLEGADTLNPTYHAPMSDSPRGETVTITLATYDEFGERKYDQIRIKIRNLDYNGPIVP